LNPLGRYQTEFVAPQARQKRARGRVLQPLGKLAQQTIAGRMAEPIVDLLEPVEIDANSSGFLVTLGGTFDRLRQKVVERGAVGQIGQRIVMGKIFNAPVCAR
jgi:hypothetical protein